MDSPPKTRRSTPWLTPTAPPASPTQYEVPYSAYVESQLEYIFSHAPGQKLMLVDPATRKMMRDRLGASGGQLRRWWIGKQHEIRRMAARRPATRGGSSGKNDDAAYSEEKIVVTKAAREEATASFAKLMRDSFGSDSMGNRAVQLERALKQLVESNVGTFVHGPASKVFIAEPEVDIELLQATRLDVGSWFRVSEPTRQELVVYFSRAERAFIFWTPHENIFYRIILPIESIANLEILLDEKNNKSLLIFHRTPDSSPIFELAHPSERDHTTRDWIRTGFDWTCEQQASSVESYSLYVDNLAGMMEVIQSIGRDNEGWAEKVLVGEWSSGSSLHLPAVVASTSASTSNSRTAYVGPPSTLAHVQSGPTAADLTSLASIAPLNSLPPSLVSGEARREASVTIRRGDNVGKRIVFIDITKRPRAKRPTTNLRRSSRFMVEGGGGGKSHEVPAYFANLDYAAVEDDASEEGVPDLIHFSSPTPARSTASAPPMPPTPTANDEFEFSFAYPHDQFEDTYTPTSYLSHQHHDEGPFVSRSSQKYDEEEIALYDQFNFIPSPEKLRREGMEVGGAGVYGKFGNEEWEIRSVVVVEENGRATLTSSPPRGR